MLRELLEYECHHESLARPWSNTATGHAAPVLDPAPSDVHIEDIAIALSRQCRFGGHVRRDVEHYSVAQHSVIVSRVCRPEHAFIGLMHDAAEAYVQDVVRPLKRVLGSVYTRAEQAWALAIGQRFGLGDALVVLPEDVLDADDAALATERRDLIDHRGRDWQLRARPLQERIHPLRGHLAYRLFMNRFEELAGGAK